MAASSLLCLPVDLRIAICRPVNSTSQQTGLHQTQSHIAKESQSGAHTASELPPLEQECHIPPHLPRQKPPVGKSSEGLEGQVGGTFHDCEGKAAVKIDVSFPARLHVGAEGSPLANAVPDPGLGTGDGVLREDAGAAAVADWGKEMTHRLGRAPCFKLERLGAFSMRLTTLAVEFQVVFSKQFGCLPRFFVTLALHCNDTVA